MQQRITITSTGTPINTAATTRIKIIQTAIRAVTIPSPFINGLWVGLGVTAGIYTSTRNTQTSTHHAFIHTFTALSFLTKNNLKHIPFPWSMLLDSWFTSVNIIPVTDDIADGDTRCGDRNTCKLMHASATFYMDISHQHMLVHCLVPSYQYCPLLLV